MGTLRRGTSLKTVAYSLALLGTLIIALSGYNLMARDDQALKASVGAPARPKPATNRRIERLQERLRVRPADHDAYIQLGGSYLRKTRETGDPTYLTRAEQSLLAALEINPNSSGAMNLLGSMNLGLHRFQEALEWAQRSLEISPVNPVAYGVLGDAQIELGQYEAAFESYQRMIDLKPNLDSYARVSYARKLTGDVDGAIEAMQAAVADGPPGTESIAWARVQLGNLYFDSGRADEAARHYAAALRDFDSYYLALAAQGKVNAAQGRLEEAIELYQRAVAIIPQPVIVAALGDLYAKTGRPAQAQLQYDTVEIIARLADLNRQLYNRDLALFYADHNIKPEVALELTARELEIRRDIYGQDALAWALYKNDRLAEAAEAVDEALKLGTQDPLLYYHAGKIHAGLGNNGRARMYLERAVALNPNFSILYADDARQTLSELRHEAALSNAPEGR